MCAFPEKQEDGWLLSTDKNKLNLSAIHQFLSVESYWAKGVPLATVQKSIEHSICLGAYHTDQGLAGFGRLITDRATFAYLCDVFVLTPFRGKGLGKLMMNYFCEMADDFGLRRFILTTQDAHSFYRESGFEPFPWPERLMSRTAIST